FVERLAHIGNSAHEHRPRESEDLFIEPLRTGPDAQGAVVVGPDIKVHGEVLVRAQVVDDSAAPLAVDHVGVESAGSRTEEGSDPRDGLTAEGVDEWIVLDRKRDIPPLFRKHDPPPCSWRQCNPCPLTVGARAITARPPSKPSVLPTPRRAR